MSKDGRLATSRSQDDLLQGSKGDLSANKDRRRRFKPWRAMKKLFTRGRARSRGREDDEEGSRSKSTTALHVTREDCADTTLTANQRSMSEESVFSKGKGTPKHKPSAGETAVSMEILNQAELFERLRSPSQSGDEGSSKADSAKSRYVKHQDRIRPSGPAPSTSSKPVPASSKPSPASSKPAPTSSKPTPTSSKPTPTSSKPTPTSSKPSPACSKPDRSMESSSPAKPPRIRAKPPPAKERKKEREVEEEPGPVDLDVVPTSNRLSTDFARHKIAVKPARQRRNHPRRNLTVEVGALPGIAEITGNAKAKTPSRDATPDRETEPTPDSPATDGDVVLRRKNSPKEPCDVRDGETPPSAPIDVKPRPKTMVPSLSPSVMQELQGRHLKTPGRSTSRDRVKEEKDRDESPVPMREKVVRGEERKSKGQSLGVLPSSQDVKPQEKLRRSPSPKVDIWEKRENKEEEKAPPKRAASPDAKVSRSPVRQSPLEEVKSEKEESKTPEPAVELSEKVAAELEKEEVKKKEVKLEDKTVSPSSDADDKLSTPKRAGDSRDASPARRVAGDRRSKTQPVTLDQVEKASSRESSVTRTTSLNDPRPRSMALHATGGEERIYDNLPEWAKKARRSSKRWGNDDVDLTVVKKPTETETPTPTKPTPEAPKPSSEKVSSSVRRRSPSPAKPEVRKEGGDSKPRQEGGAHLSPPRKTVGGRRSPSPSREGSGRRDKSPAAADEVREVKEKANEVSRPVASSVKVRTPSPTKGVSEENSTKVLSKSPPTSVVKDVKESKVSKEAEKMSVSIEKTEEKTVKDVKGSTVLQKPLSVGSSLATRTTPKQTPVAEKLAAKSTPHMATEKPEKPAPEKPAVTKSKPETPAKTEDDTTNVRPSQFLKQFGGRGVYSSTRGEKSRTEAGDAPVTSNKPSVPSKPSPAAKSTTGNKPDPPPADPGRNNSAKKKGGFLDDVKLEIIDDKKDVVKKEEPKVTKTPVTKPPEKKVPAKPKVDTSPGGDDNRKSVHDLLKRFQMAPA